MCPARETTRRVAMQLDARLAAIAAMQTLWGDFV